jgi:hypothetical protein
MRELETQFEHKAAELRAAFVREIEANPIRLFNSADPIKR